MYRKIYLYALLLFSLVFQACTTKATENNIVEKNNSGEIVNKNTYSETSSGNSVEQNQKNLEKSEKDKPAKIEYLDISNSLGLIKITDSGFRKGEIVRFYNEDGNLWNEFSLFDENDDGKVYEKIRQNIDFSPFRADPDSFHFYFDWVAENKQFYKVVVNEETKLHKFVKKDDPHFKSDSWENYVLNCFAVEFDDQNNPLRKEINGQIIKNLDKGLSFQPKEIRGNWLKVKPFDLNKVKDENNSDFGWIKWKDDNKIVINFFEDA